MQIFRRLNKHAKQNDRPLFLFGLSVVMCRHLFLWFRENRLAKRLRPHYLSSPVMTRKPSVSALVAAWNETTHIDAHIRSFAELSYPSIELILCAGGTDDTFERARRYTAPNIIVLKQHPGEGKQAALARCCAQASGEVLYFTDADCTFDDAALCSLLAPLVEEDEQAATGCSRPLDDQLGKVLPTYLWASDVMASAHQTRYSTGILGRNAAITRVTLDRCGGLDFAAPTGTDYHLAQRLLRHGVPIRYVPTSVVPSAYPETLGEYRGRQSRWLRNLLIYGREYGAIGDVIVSAKTIAVGLLTLLFPLTALWFGSTMLLLWCLLMLHATAAKLRYVLFTARLYRWRIPPRLFVNLLPLRLMDFAVWVVPLFDLLSPRRRRRW